MRWGRGKITEDEKIQQDDRVELHPDDDEGPDALEAFDRQWDLRLAASELLGSSSSGSQRQEATHQQPSVAGATSDTNPAPGSSATTLTLPGHPPADEKLQKSCMKQLREAHAKWDRVRRGWAAVKELSSPSENTQGCKFESELTGLLADGKEIDAWLANNEKQGMTNYRFTTADAAAIKGKSTELKATIKKGQDRMHALNAWLRIT